LEGKPVRRSYLKVLKTLRKRLNRTPKLFILSDGSEDSRIYERSIRRLARELDVEIVGDLNDCDGAIQLGRPQIELPPEKDIEGISEYHLGRIAYGKPLFVPPTPMAAIRLLEFYGYPLVGEEAVVVGRSVRVGKPLGLLLLNRDATLTLLHSKSRNIKNHTRQVRFAFLAAGVGEYFGRDYFSPHSVVIDIATVPKDGRVVGDARYEELLNWVEAITPVPGGVGSVTPLVLFENLFKAVSPSLRTIGSRILDVKGP